MLFTFQWKQEKNIASFSLVPGLIWTFQCFRRSKKAKAAKPDHKMNQYLHAIDQYLLTSNITNKNLSLFATLLDKSKMHIKAMI